MYQAIVFLPLLGFLIVGLFGRSLGAKASEYITSGFMVVAAVLSWVAFASVGIQSTDSDAGLRQAEVATGLRR